MEKTILVVLDAFRHDYINPEVTPFLNSLLESSKYYKKLIPSYGFCERTEIMVGLESHQSNYFTAIGYNKFDSPYNHISGLLKLLSKIEKKSPVVIKKIIRRLLWEYISHKEYGFASFNIPLDSLPYFSLTEDGEDSIINKSPDSIINIARKHGKSVNLTSFTSLDSKMVGGDDDRIDNLINSLKKDNDSLYLLYMSSSDHFGHKYGPDTQTFKNELFILDKKIQHLYNSANIIHDNINWLFVGDHGMTQINHRLDLLSKIDTALTGFKFGEDYIYFADSTVFRIWFLNENKKKEISIQIYSLFNLSSISNFGQVSTEHDLGLKGNRTYGDILWLANPGVVISPDFFNSSDKKICGMHGYNPNLSESCYGMAIIISDKIKSLRIDSAPLTEIYNELKLLIKN